MYREMYRWKRTILVGVLLAAPLATAHVPPQPHTDDGLESEAAAATALVRAELRAAMVAEARETLATQRVDAKAEAEVGAPGRS